MRETELTDVERQILRGCVAGEPVDLGTGEPAGPDFDPDAWGEDRLVRAAALVAILRGDASTTAGRLRGLRLSGARVSGPLIADDADIDCRLDFSRCLFEQDVVLDGARTRRLTFYRCSLPALRAVRASVTGSLNLTGSRLRLVIHGARITGNLVLNAAELAGSGMVALGGENITIEENLYAGRPYDDPTPFRSRGSLVLNGARINGRIEMSGAELVNPGGQTISAHNLVVGQNLSCTAAIGADGVVPFTSDGEISLNGAHVSGNLDLDGAVLRNPAGRVLSGFNLVVERNVLCRIALTDSGTVAARFRADGEIFLGGAAIGGYLRMDGAELNNPDGRTIDADGLTVGRNLMCTAGDQTPFESHGTIWLAGARIDGDCEFDGATLVNPGRHTLVATNFEVHQSLLGRPILTSDHRVAVGFASHGEMLLHGAQVGGSVNLGGATLSNTAGRVLTADNLTVGRNVQLGARAHPDGTPITGDDGRPVAAFTATNDIRLVNASVAGVVWLSDPAPTGRIDLSRTRVGTLYWPGSDARVVTDGLIYDRLEPHLPARERLARLRAGLDGQYRAQPFEQLANNYRQLGEDDQARTVLIAARRARNRARRPLPRWFGHVHDALAGYGYAPGRALALLALAWIAGTVYFWLDPARPASPTTPTVFNPGLYALDVLLPTAPFGQEPLWSPTPAGSVVNLILQVTGWALSLAVLPALARAFSRG